jgi:hypothetical protein
MSSGTECLLTCAQVIAREVLSMINSRHIAAVATGIAMACMLVMSHVSLLNDADAATQAGITEQLVGSWSLVSRVTTSSDGKIVTDAGLSATPKGVLIYDRAGHVAAQLSRPGRTAEMLEDECREAQKVKGTNDTSQTILGYDAYFGTYTVNEKEGIVTHHLESALFPGDIGSLAPVLLA